MKENIPLVCISSYGFYSIFVDTLTFHYLSMHIANTIYVIRLMCVWVTKEQEEEEVREKFRIKRQKKKEISPATSKTTFSLSVFGIVVRPLPLLSLSRCSSSLFQFAKCASSWYNSLLSNKIRLWKIK